MTDQKSVAFMYNNSPKGKVKNDKIQRWRVELSCYNSYDVIYRPGKDNQAADTLSKAFCSSVSTSTTNSPRETLLSLHSSVAHPGVTQMYHFVMSRNSPFSLDEVRRVTANCRTCSEPKPSFYKPQGTALIKATLPFERLKV